MDFEYLKDPLQCRTFRKIEVSLNLIADAKEMIDFDI